MKISSFCRISFFACTFLYVIYGCSNSYITSKPITSAADYPDAIEQAKKDDRHFILHSGINVYTVTSFLLDRAKQSITVHLAKVDSLHIVNVENAQNNADKPKKSASGAKEIHIYTKDSTSYTLDEPHTIPFDNVGNIDMVGKG